MLGAFPLCYFGLMAGDPAQMAVRETENEVRELGLVRGDYWDRFDRLQRNLGPFLRGKPKRAPIERFRSYADLEYGRSDASPGR